MTRVSRLPVEKDVYEDITQTFYHLIDDLNGDEARKFFDDFLTEEEKLMLSKRLAVAQLIRQGFDYPEIKGILKVSNGTISGVKHWLKYKKGFEIGLEKVIKRENYGELDRKVGEFLKHMPPTTRSIKARAKWLNR